jgi:hypothetical protein
MFIKSKYYLNEFCISKMILNPVKYFFFSVLMKWQLVFSSCYMNGFYAKCFLSSIQFIINFVEMKTLALKNYGFKLSKHLEIIDVNTKELGDNDVLIDVYVAGLNPVDFKIIYGMATVFNRPKRPFSLGFDLSGIVLEVGRNIKEFKVGDEVYAKVPWDQMGTVSEKVVVEEQSVSLKPVNQSFEEAAAMPLVACTVYDAFEVAEIKEGSKVLIIGGSGGTGTFAIQYAKSLGAIVYTVTSGKNIELVKSLGADEVIDYTKEKFNKIIKDLDVVFDTVGGRYPWKSIAVVKSGGKIISIAGHHDNATLKKVNVARIFRWAFLIKGSFLMIRMKQNNIFYKHVWSYPSKDKLEFIKVLIESGAIKATIDKVYNFEDAIEALKYLATNRAKGKVLIKIKE